MVLVLPKALVKGAESELVLPLVSSLVSQLVWR